MTRRRMGRLGRLGMARFGEVVWSLRVCHDRARAGIDMLGWHGHDLVRANPWGFGSGKNTATLSNSRYDYLTWF